MANLVFLIVVLMSVIVQQGNGYKSGWSYVYDYETRVEHVLNGPVQVTIDQYNGRSSKHRVYVNVHDLNGAIAKMEMRITDSNEKLHVLIEVNRETMSLINMRYSSKDITEQVNLKRVLVDLLNVNLNSSKETSVIGECEVKHERHEQNGGIIKKIKYNCRQASNRMEYKTHNKAFDGELIRSTEIEYKLLKQEQAKGDYMIIDEIAAIDRLDYEFVLSSSQTKSIRVRQSMKLIDRIEIRGDGSTEIKDDEYRATSLLIDYQNGLQDTNQNINVNQLKRVVNEIVNDLKPGTSIGCRNILKLIQFLRKHENYISESDLTSVQGLFKNAKALNILVDAFVAAQTNFSFKSLRKYLFGTEAVVIKNEKRFQSLIFCCTKLHETSSNEVDALLKQLQQLISPTSSIVDLTLKSLLSQTIKNRKAVSDLLIGQIGNKCKDDECKLKYLRLLPNSDNADIMEQMQINECQAPKKNKKLCLLVFESIKHKLSTSELFQIFQSSNETNELRFSSLDQLIETLMTNSKHSSGDFIDYLFKGIFQPNTKNIEFQTYAIKLILYKLNEKPELRREFLGKLYGKYLNNLIEINNKADSDISVNSMYNDDLNGISVRSVLKQLNTEYDHLIKFLNYNILFENTKKNITVNLLSFNINAENLNGILNQQSGGDDGAGQPNAYFEMSLMNKKIETIELFNGLTSLMSNIWNAPERLTRIFSLNTLINDQNEYIQLTNGFTLRFNTLGLLSMDVLGKADISLWSQYANTQIKTRISYEMRNEMRITNPTDRLSNALVLNSNLNTNVTLNFNFNSNFQNEPVKMCVKLLMDKVYLRQTFSDNQMKAQSKPTVVRKSILYTYEPLTFMFSNKTTTLCNNRK